MLLLVLDLRSNINTDAYTKRYLVIRKRQNVIIKEPSKPAVGYKFLGMIFFSINCYGDKLDVYFKKKIKVFPVYPFRT